MSSSTNRQEEVNVLIMTWNSAAVATEDSSQHDEWHEEPEGGVSEWLLAGLGAATPSLKEISEMEDMSSERGTARMSLRHQVLKDLVEIGAFEVAEKLICELTHARERWAYHRDLLTALITKGQEDAARQYAERHYATDPPWYFEVRLQIHTAFPSAEDAEQLREMIKRRLETVENVLDDRHVVCAELYAKLWRCTHVEADLAKARLHASRCEVTFEACRAYRAIARYSAETSDYIAAFQSLKRGRVAPPTAAAQTLLRELESHVLKDVFEQLSQRALMAILAAATSTKPQMGVLSLAAYQVISEQVSPLDAEWARTFEEGLAFLRDAEAMHLHRVPPASLVPRYKAVCLP